MTNETSPSPAGSSPSISLPTLASRRRPLIFTYLIQTSPSSYEAPFLDPVSDLPHACSLRIPGRFRIELLRTRTPEFQASFLAILAVGSPHVEGIWLSSLKEELPLFCEPTVCPDVVTFVFQGETLSSFPHSYLLQLGHIALALHQILAELAILKDDPHGPSYSPSEPLQLTRSLQFLISQGADWTLPAPHDNTQFGNSPLLHVRLLDETTTTRGRSSSCPSGSRLTPLGLTTPLLQETTQEDKAVTEEEALERMVWPGGNVEEMVEEMEDLVKDLEEIEALGSSPPRGPSYPLPRLGRNDPPPSPDRTTQMVGMVPRTLPLRQVIARGSATTTADFRWQLSSKIPLSTIPEWNGSPTTVIQYVSELSYYQQLGDSVTEHLAQVAPFKFTGLAKTWFNGLSLADRLTCTANMTNFLIFIREQFMHAEWRYDRALSSTACTSDEARSTDTNSPLNGSYGVLATPNYSTRRSRNRSDSMQPRLR
ncbi:TY3B-TY3B protein [Salix suchowensis]|nr:TY3B-TY3B protein [Salix suchowensis]